MVKYALITGASSGFGAAIASSLAKEGYGLILTARRLDRLIALKETLSQESPDIIIGKLHVRDRAAVNQWVDALGDHVKQNLSVLINNAGLAAGRSTIDQGLASDWEQMIDTNLTGLLYVDIESQELHETLNTVHRPLNKLTEKELCPGNDALDSINESLR